jgi:flagellar basal-body rod protein FlgB
MDLANSSFFGLLRARLDQLSERQRLVAENIANASTPGFQPHDLDSAGFERALADAAGGGGLRMAQTNPMHMSPAGSASVRVVEAPDSETTIDGNSVVLEDQMARSADTRMAFETNLALYQKGLQLVRLAIKSPTR